MAAPAPILDIYPASSFAPDDFCIGNLRDLSTKALRWLADGKPPEHGPRSESKLAEHQVWSDIYATLNELLALLVFWPHEGSSLDRAWAVQYVEGVLRQRFDYVTGVAHFAGADPTEGDESLFARIVTGLYLKPDWTTHEAPEQRYFVQGYPMFSVSHTWESAYIGAQTPIEVVEGREDVIWDLEPNAHGLVGGLFVHPKTIRPATFNEINYFVGKAPSPIVITDYLSLWDEAKPRSPWGVFGEHRTQAQTAAPLWQWDKAKEIK